MYTKLGCFKYRWHGQKRSVAMVLIAVVFIFAIAGCNKPDKSAPTIAKLNAQLKIQFEQPVVHYQLGKIYQQQGDWNKAASEFDLAVKFDPVFWDAQASMIKVLRLAGEEEKSAEYGNNYIKAASGFPEDSLALGRAFEQQNIDDYALKAYEQALKLAPKSPVVNKQLGYYYLNRNNNEMAKTYFRRSFELDPYQADVAGELGKMGIRVQVLQPPPQKPAAKPAPKK